MIVNYMIALIMPLVLAAVLSRVIRNVWVSIIATFGIMMVGFDGAYQPLPVILIGAAAGLIGMYIGYLWLKKNNLTE
ncbi:hypothetical protein DFP93_10820 [Aneurinibacillus soli]|uniref:Uncharacterized protein n=1 Tax=Aneurinibacillus soli TaxID=1500254 RepID=A0A0U5B8R5_9BACL|nr:hypothetical protein [Aneurinibacillus soli]PYE61447.1 hypothetical protein DFP93_10820 [Aneurinibacillus soli]BAU26599.1 hypothetical protein CB4_00726 [Aneurinibacillus soli]